jgi:hypothetical protein
VLHTPFAHRLAETDSGNVAAALNAICHGYQSSASAAEDEAE